MSSDFTSRKLAWLEEVARVRALPRSAVALAVLLACRYFNGETGEAWPAESTLAHDLGITQANAHMAVERLIAAKSSCTDSRVARARQTGIRFQNGGGHLSDLASKIAALSPAIPLAILPTIVQRHCGQYQNPGMNP